MTGASKRPVVADRRSPVPGTLQDSAWMIARQADGCQRKQHTGAPAHLWATGSVCTTRGDYHSGCPDSGLTLAWRYRVIRLWLMPAEELLALGRPALLTLIGQTRIAEPALAECHEPTPWDATTPAARARFPRSGRGDWAW